MKNCVYLLIGGNLRDRFKLLDQAKSKIQKEIGKIEKESSIYETAAWGFKSENYFLNQAIIISTDFEAVEVLKICQKIENKLGRTRGSDQYASRTMDIDILFFNDGIINEPELIVPHQHIHKRRFTLDPLAEIAPDFVHPVLNKTLKQLLKDCSDNSEVKKV
jgi:2-amino-4-hydroxy-6-hydroxymethyldihydropteridine diphosphokinase